MNLESSGKTFKTNKTNIITFPRKIMQPIGQLIPAFGLIVLSFVDCPSFSGFEVNQIELSPNYAGALMGIGNMLGNMFGFITAFVAGVIVNKNQTLEGWTIVFLISSGVYILCNAIFAFFGSTKVEKWNNHWEHALGCIDAQTQTEDMKVN